MGHSFLQTGSVQIDGDEVSFVEAENLSLSPGPWPDLPGDPPFLPLLSPWQAHIGFLNLLPFSLSQLGTKSGIGVGGGDHKPGERAKIFNE